MITAVVKSSQLGVDLVQDNYYDADIAYESFRQKRSNATELTELPQIQILNSTQEVIIDFGVQWSKVNGEVIMYSPSSTARDKKFDSRVVEGKMRLSTEDLTSGKWTLKLDWKGDGIPYYMENTVII